MNDRNQPASFPLWPNGAPGSEHWPQRESEMLLDPADPQYSRVIWNIAQPSLTAYLPDPALANGTAVVVCPGGGHHFLMIDKEGTSIADWLTARGVAAFVLKYRLIETPACAEDFALQVQNLFWDIVEDRDHMHARLDQHGPLAIADGQQAMRLLRSRAAEWDIAPDRIGIMGFSAGAFVAAGSALDYDAASRPSFVAPIYGALWHAPKVPADAPPLFIALASDDTIAVEPCLKLYRAWQQAGRAAELHIYAQGGHGFGLRQQNLPADSWIDRFGDWLDALGLLPPDRA